MRKCLCVLLAFLLGCQAEPVKETEEPEVVREPVKRSDIADKTSEVISLLLIGGSVPEEDPKLVEMTSEWAFLQSEGCTVNAGKYNLEDMQGVTDLVCQNSRYLAEITYDEDLHVSNYSLQQLNKAPELSVSEKYEEIPVMVGKFPSLYGILTVPAGNASAPVALLLPDGFENTADQSGDDPYFRRDLAHGLAERGIASLRWETRRSEMPVSSVEELVRQDFASAAHMLERYPVNAANIICIGHGLGGTIAHSLVYSHFEITGGLIMIDPLYYDLLEEMVPADRVDQVRHDIWMENAPETADDISSELLRQYDLLNSIHYLNNVKMKTLVIAGVSSDDFSSWKDLFRKYTNVTAKQYTGLDHSMRISGGTMSRTALNDIRDWIGGKKIR